MSRFLVAAFGALLVLSVGCQRDGSARGTVRTRDAQMMSNDACQHCPGVQTLRADGTCPSCNKKMTSANMLSADACPHCEGVQAATADGKCAACEAKK
jgi:Zn-finger nucleic acid-binding protein